MDILAAGNSPKPMFLPKNFELSMLRQRRKANGYPKQADVAKALGRHVQTIKRLEAKGIPPLCDARDWVKLQHIYGLTIEQFAHLQELVKEGNINGCVLPAVYESPVEYTVKEDQQNAF